MLVLSSCHSGKTTEVPDKGFVSWLPAKTWEDALLTGNGTIGAMVMGNPFEETIILNHALLYLPQADPLVPPNMAKHLDKIRILSFEGKWKEAAELGVKVWKDAGYGDKKWSDPYVPAANITINMPASDVSVYRRMVDFNTAEATVDWEDQNGRITRKTFASRADSAIISQITGTGSINAAISIKAHPHSWEQNEMINSLIRVSETKAISNNLLLYHCRYAKPNRFTPLGYYALLRIVNSGGETKTTDSDITITEATDVLFYTIIKPYYNKENQLVDEMVKKIQAISTNYATLLDAQKKTHGALYERMALNLFPTREEQEMTSETLVLKAREETSPGIIQRQFEAARYNILCSTGTNPPNLQGIWSGTWTPPWSGTFTHDGNIEVAVSNLLNGNMPELMQAYFNYYLKRLPQYRTNAGQLYGTRGIHVATQSSSHGYTNHYDETWCLEYWNGGAGWTASNFYDHFLYTRDTVFLKETAFPFMTEALNFWEDFLITDENSMYVSAPSYSPENNPLEHRWQNSINATMDFAIIKQLIQNWLEAARILNISPDRRMNVESMLSHIPVYQINENGVLKEWMWPGFTDNQSHRHASHLYGLYDIPDSDITGNTERLKAAKKTIHERMKIRTQHRGGDMAFGMCLLGFAAVNAGDKATANEILQYLSRFYWTNSMATTHNPGNLFNMDISGGFPSLITRMLANSQPGKVQLLSALPDDWTTGEVTGILLRGNIVIDRMTWNESEVSVTFRSKHKQSLHVDLGLPITEHSEPKTTKNITLTADKPLTLTWQIK